MNDIKGLKTGLSEISVKKSQLRIEKVRKEDYRE